MVRQRVRYSVLFCFCLSKPDITILHRTVSNDLIIIKSFFVCPKKFDCHKYCNLSYMLSHLGRRRNAAYIKFCRHSVVFLFHCTLVFFFFSCCTNGYFKEGRIYTGALMILCVSNVLLPILMLLFVELFNFFFLI